LLDTATADLIGVGFNVVAERLSDLSYGLIARKGG
jgi:hypothetical protein